MQSGGGGLKAFSALRNSLDHVCVYPISRRVERSELCHSALAFKYCCRSLLGVITACWLQDRVGYCCTMLVLLQLQRSSASKPRFSF